MNQDKMREALRLALEYWRHRQQRYKNRRPVWVELAEQALASEPAQPKLDAATHMILSAGASSGDVGALTLAAQLAGVPSCLDCGFVKHHCKCEPAQAQPVDPKFIADIQRSRTKHPGINRMFDGLLGELHELKRAYGGDGDIRAEAFDVAVCAYRIATEGDLGFNQKLEHVPDWMAWDSPAPTQPAQAQPAQPVAEMVWMAGIPNTMKEVRFFGENFLLPVGTKFYTHPPAAVTAQPVAWLVTWDDAEAKNWVQAHASEITAVNQANVRNGICTPLYTHPPAAVVSQLVEALNWAEARLEELGEHMVAGKCAADLKEAREAGL